MTRLDRITMQGFKSFANRITIPFPEGFNVICGPNGSGKSCRGDTEVMLSTGELVPIKDLVNGALDASSNVSKLDDGVFTTDNPDNVSILGLDTKRMKVVEKPVGAFVKRDGEDVLYKIKTKTGRSVTTTGCHPVMVLRNGKIVSEVVQNLKEGDLLASPRKLNINTNNDFSYEGHQLTPDLSRFLGYLVGDGYMTFNRFEFVNAEENLLDDFESLTKSLFGFDVQYRKATGSHGKAARIIYWSAEVPELFAKIFRTGDTKKLTSAYKTMPPEILMSSQEVLANFLAGLFDCDATVRKRNPTFSYTTKNEKLADQVQTALLGFGIVARKKCNLKYATNTKKKTRRKYYYIFVEGKKDLQTLYKNIPMRTARKVRRLKRLAERNVKTNPNNDVLPKEANKIIKRCVKLLGLEYKKLRKKYPFFAAYIENRCHPTRAGVSKTVDILKARLEHVENIMAEMILDQKIILENMKQLKIWRHVASEAIGLSSSTINSHWAHSVKANKKNLEKLHNYVKKESESRIKHSKKLISVLESLAGSDIFWDRIEKIEEVPGDRWVYDLSVPECRNFVGNGIFVHNSNVVDALLFVLGTSSARSIRAMKLKNLIFNGSKKRGASDYCEVSLYIDNSAGELPGDEEIKISRRITRSGVSVYKLNGRTVTRSKILDILSHANLSPDGYNIIMQGDVTNIIEMTHRERREILDEISGISEFDEKKEKAVRELDKVETRVRENMIVVAEKQRLVSRLKEEKENAEKYMKLENELKKSRASLAKKKLGQALARKSEVDAKIDEMQAELDEVEEDFQSVENELENKEKDLEEKGELIIEKSRSHDLLKEINSITSEIEKKRNRIEMNEREVSMRSGSSSRTVKEVLSQNWTGVHGTVSQLIKVPNKYATAIEVAAGHHREDVVVDSDGIAVQGIRFLKEKKIGRARFLPLNKIRPRKRKEYKGDVPVEYAIDLIDFDKTYQGAMEYVLGSTLVVGKIETAKKIDGFRVVTLDGDLKEASGAMLGGFYRKSKGTQNLAKENERLEKEIEKLREKLEELREKEAEESREVQQLKEMKGESSKELEELRKRRKEAYDKRMKLSNRVGELKIKRAREEASIDNLETEFADYKDVEDFYDEPVDELQKRVQSCVKGINNLGPVNMKAIEEFDTINVEFEELKKKLDRLLEEKEAVTKLVEEVEKKRQEKFMETFSEINKNFIQIYSDLMGGEGRLRLEEEDNIESGLIIEASPSGKKILDIDSMSGGEKTMASLAFLFAIMKHYASPFYVLDEVDAALDKANTKLILNLIKNYSEEVQFIVITHNDLTISEANKVFGVSMEDGVSKIFGIEMPRS